MNNIPVTSEPRTELSPHLMHFQGRSNQARHHTNQDYQDMHEDSKHSDDIPSSSEFIRSTHKTHQDSSTREHANVEGYTKNITPQGIQDSQHGLRTNQHIDDRGQQPSDHRPTQQQQQHRQQDDVSRDISIHELSLQSDSIEDSSRPRNNTITPGTLPQHHTTERHRSGSQQTVSNHHSFHPTYHQPNRYTNVPNTHHPRQDNIQPRHSDPNVISRDVNEFGLDSPTYFPVDSRDTETVPRRDTTHQQQSVEYPRNEGERGHYHGHANTTSTNRMSDATTPLPVSSLEQENRLGFSQDAEGTSNLQAQSTRNQYNEYDEQNASNQQVYQQQQHQHQHQQQLQQQQQQQQQQQLQHSQPQQQEGQRKRPPRQRFERGRVHAFRVNGSRFVIDARYMPIKPLGRGAYGIVCSATDLDYEIKVAIKRIPSAFRDIVDARRILRETQLLRSFNHPHIIGLCDVIDPGQEQLNDVYMVMELMETDLHKIIYSSNQLTDEHIQYLIYQTLRGLHYIHSHGVIHRDLKPSNLLLNQDCSLKICDFGLARIIGEQFDNSELTEYVVTRWYRAPEVMYSLQDYDYAIDVWAVGCIFAELLNRRPLFPGDDYIHQLHLMFSVLGTPKPDDLSAITNTRALSYIQSLPHQEPVDFATHFPTASPLALELLQSMLTLHPKKRISVIDALNHPFFKTIHEQYPPLEETNDIISLRAIDQCTSTEELRQLMLEMVKFYRPWYKPPSELNQDR